MMRPIIKGPQIDEFSTPNQAVMPSGNVGLPPIGNQMMGNNGNMGNQSGNGNFGGMMNPNGF